MQRHLKLLERYFYIRLDNGPGRGRKCRIEILPPENSHTKNAGTNTDGVKGVNNVTALTSKMVTDTASKGDNSCKRINNEYNQDLNLGPTIRNLILLKLDNPFVQEWNEYLDGYGFPPLDLLAESVEGGYLVPYRSPPREHNKTEFDRSIRWAGQRALKINQNKIREAM